MGEKATFRTAMSPEVSAQLGLDNASQEHLRAIVARLLSLDKEASADLLILAQAAQQHATKPTPPTAWSRFMAKIGLACGREAYGDEWLDSPQATILSDDLLGDSEPRFAQRDHHPPVEPAWPYEPPKHAIWIERFRDTAVLMITLFGQLHGGVPVNSSEAEFDLPSAWSIDPLRRTVHRTTPVALQMASTALAVERAGGTAVFVAHPEHPFVYIPDGPDGPVPLPVKLPRVESPAHALKLLADVDVDEPTA
jgi:hypothetical protein